MKALSLFGVFVLAKALVLFDRSIVSSWLAPFAYLWQDALVALVFATVEFLTRKRPWIASSLFALAMAYVAVNVPLTRELSSPLTWQMSRAASGALADSVAHYLTWANGAAMGLVAIAGAVLPWLFRGMSRRTLGVATACGLALTLVGGWAAGRVSCAGLERNALVAFATSLAPRIGATDEQLDWRRSPVGEECRVEDGATQFQGMAAGRNVVMIVLESTGADYLRPYGATEDPMPNLTKLAEKSLLFENVYAVYPESIKGLFSVLCSRYPSFDTGPGDLERVTTPSLAQVLNDVGYRTALFHSGRFMYLGMQSVIQRRGFQVMEDAGAIGGNFNSSFGVDEPSTVKRMLEWLDSVPRDRPFFMTYLPIAGHHPYETPTPGPFPETNDASQYRNALHYADTALGSLLQGLQARDLMSNTLFIVFGDHGEAFGQHEGNYGHTLFLYEENLRVPCLVFAPGMIESTLRISRPGSLIDIAPTVLELLGKPAPADHQGESLLAARNRMALFYTDYSLPLVGLRDGPWKFLHELGSRRSKLFDLSADCREEVDLAANFPELVAIYRDWLERWSRAQKGLLLGTTQPAATGRAR